MASAEFAYDSESDDDNFNPAPADLSDDEGGRRNTKGGSSSPKPRSRSRHAVEIDDNDDDDDDDEDAVRANRRRDDTKDDGDDAKSETEDKPRHRSQRDNNDDEDDDDDEDDRDLKRGRDDDEDEEDDEEADEEADEEEEEDEDDEDDVQASRHRHKRARRDGGAAFFDIEAEVDDEDEAEDEEREIEEIGDFIENPDEVEEINRNDDRQHRDLDRRRELEQGMDAEKAAEMYRQRYGNRRPNKGFGESAAVPRRLLLPSVEDPSIWAVRCKEGKEREVIFSIMKRIEERLGTKDELGITAAFERGGTTSVMKGYIYVEALRQTDIMTALDGMLNVYPRNKLILVEIKDMPDLFRVTKTPTLETGAFVRIRRPLKYSGDLAQVVAVTENGLEARVRFMPRIDYVSRDDAAAAAAAARLGPNGKPFKRPPGVAGPRPPQRLFSEVEARKRNPKNFIPHAQPNTWTYNNDYFEDGFLIKDIKLQQLIVKDVNPTLEEVAKLTLGSDDGTENLDLKALAASLKDSKANVAYVPGDVVEVYAGEQKGVVGKAISIVGDIVTIDVTDGELRGTTIEAPTKGLRKRFRVGDHVKVIGGRFRDDVGMVVKIDQDRVTLLTDQSNSEITVFSKDLREASDSGGQGSLGQYSLLDLVQLDVSTVGCIIKIDRETLVVLDQYGDTRQLMPSQISNLLPKNKLAVAADRNGSEIRLDDVVKEHGGQRRQGKIIHIHRSHLFMHSNETTQNAGVFVAQTTNVSTVAAKGGRVSAAASGGPDLSTMNPALKRNNGGPGGGGSSNMAPPQRTFGRDRALGQTVTIRRGGYKGLLGIVKDTTDVLARVELHTKNKIVTVNKSDLIFKDKLTGRVIDINARGGRGGASGGFGRGGISSSSSSGPAWESGGGRTPAPGGGDRTPAWGLNRASHTPAWNRDAASGARTPAWAGDGSRTVNPYDGSRTAYGSGARTPAWNSGAKTPGYDGFGHGSKTPAWGGSGSSGSDAWGAGSKTPGYGMSAPTPVASGNDTDNWGYTPGANGMGAFDAPTPGAGLGAPTPGPLSAPTPAYGAPTPGAALSAPTPGVAWQSSWGADSAPTPVLGAPTPAPGGVYYGAPTPAPYGGVPETPGASGPRYADDD